MEKELKNIEVKKFPHPYNGGGNYLNLMQVLMQIPCLIPELKLI